MTEIGIGILGGGYMGKAHSVAMSSVGAVFDTALRPRLEMICASSTKSAERYRKAYGFARATDDWQVLVNDPRVEAVVIATPQSTHRPIAEAAFALGKPVFCEKPLGASLDDSRAMVAAAESSGCPNMVGFNYIRTPASQYARQLIAEGAIGDITWFRGEHTEDFYADPDCPATWRTTGMSNGTMGDLAPHMINGALALIGPIARLIAGHLPIIHRALGIATSRMMLGEHLGRNGDAAVSLCLENRCELRVDIDPTTSQQALVGCIADQRMLESIPCFERRAATENEFRIRQLREGTCELGIR